MREWVGVSKTSFRLDALEGLTGFRKDGILTGTVYCSKRVQIKSSRRGRYPGWRCQEKPDPSFQSYALLVESLGQHSTFPVMQRDSTCEGKFTWSLPCRVFVGGQSRRGRYSSWMTDLLSLQPPRPQTNTTWPRVSGWWKQIFTLSHLVSINCLLWLTPCSGGLRPTETFLSGRMCLGFRAYLPGISQGLIFSLECAELAQKLI